MRIATELAHLDQVGDEEFIRQSYLHLFHREPDPSGAAYYGEQLAAGAPRTQLIGAWAGSDEHVNRVVAEVYPNLSRYPGLGEGGDLLHAWSARAGLRSAAMPLTCATGSWISALADIEARRAGFPGGWCLSPAKA